MSKTSNTINEPPNNLTHEGEPDTPTLLSLATVDKPVSPDLALTLIRQTADALAEASQAGFVHKNLRPETIIIQQQDLPVKLNFDAPSPQSEAEDWDMRYASPEQKEGKVLDSRSNIFTLGVILCELIFDTLPDEATDPLAETFSSENGYQAVSSQTIRIIETCCRKEPWARYQTWLELEAAIDRALAVETTTAESPTVPVVPPGKSAVRSRSLAQLVKTGTNLNPRLLPIAAILIFLLLLGLAMVRSWTQNVSDNPSIPIFQQLPLLFSGQLSPANQTRQSIEATGTIQALEIRLSTRTPTPSPTSENQLSDSETPLASVPSETPLSLSPTATANSTDLPSPPTETPTETPTNTAVPSSSPTLTRSPLPPGTTNTPVPTPSTIPTSPPNPTNAPTSTPPQPPTPTPPPAPTPTPPVFPTSTPEPTNTPQPTITPSPVGTSQPTSTPPI